MTREQKPRLDGLPATPARAARKFIHVGYSPTLCGKLIRPPSSVPEAHISCPECLNRLNLPVRALQSKGRR